MTADEMRELVLELCGEESSGLDGMKVTVTKRDKTFVIDAQRMYEYLPLTYQIFKKLDEAVGGAANIVETSRYQSPGCATCDYGSCYKWTLEVTPKG